MGGLDVLTMLHAYFVHLESKDREEGEEGVWNTDDEAPLRNTVVIELVDVNNVNINVVERRSIII